MENYIGGTSYASFIYSVSHGIITAYIWSTFRCLSNSERLMSPLVQIAGNYGVMDLPKETHTNEKFDAKPRFHCKCHVSGVSTVSREAFVLYVSGRNG